jgi:nanoRNase/pAp phosphatase (c-di-AMP/oligoRNAs hydrolase)
MADWVSLRTRRLEAGQAGACADRGFWGPSLAASSHNLRRTKETLAGIGVTPLGAQRGLGVSSARVPPGAERGRHRHQSVLSFRMSPYNPRTKELALPEGKHEPKRTIRSQRLIDILRGASEVLVMTHDNPDPDAIASGWGVCVLVQQTLSAPTRLLAGGAITRAENRTLIDILKPPLQMIENWLPPENVPLVLVDTHSPPRLAHVAAGQPLAAVIDHHKIVDGGAGGFSFKFRDIRPSVLATSSMVAGYLREQVLTPSSVLATALTYGIHSDAMSYESRFSRVDRAALSWLSQFLDHDLLKKIEHPTLPKEYYGDLVLALESSFIYDQAAICVLPRAAGPEVVGEIADLLIRCDGVDCVLCAAKFAERIVISVRTTTKGGNATELIDMTLKDTAGASWGGHEHRAGGYIDVSAAESGKRDLEAELRLSWLRAAKVEKERGQRLIAPKEVIKALK